MEENSQSTKEVVKHITFVISDKALEPFFLAVLRIEHRALCMLSNALSLGYLNLLHRTLEKNNRKIHLN